jgi:hypothetical protein
MSFIPNTGDFFYCSVRPRTIEQAVGNPLMGTTEVVKVRHTDGSYQDKIFQCIARDDTMMVVKVVVGGSSWEREQTENFRISRLQFDPVGPEVRRYYQLDQTQEQA